MSQIPQSVRDRLTPPQLEAIEAVEEHGGVDAAAAALGKNRRSFQRLLSRARREAAKVGWAPEHDMVKPSAEGFSVKGTSTLYTRDKETGAEQISAQWVKTRQDRESAAEQIRHFAEAWTEELRGKIRPVKQPKQSNSDLMTLYPMGDPHFGLYCWSAEVGEDFDLDIAERDLCAAVDHLVGQSPPSKRGALVNLGDFYHYDSMKAITPASGHVLDADSRPQKMVQIGVRALRRCIHRMLEKHDHVEIVNAPGNHDEVLGRVLNVMLANIYESEPRVTVYDDPTTRHYIQHGACIVGVTHGDKTKDADLPGIMATERPEQWGQTRYRYYWRGHHHQDRVMEYNGCKVEQFRTLTPGDAYAVGHGYLSSRDMKAVVLHKERGEIARFTCGIDILREINEGVSNGR